ncbi:FMN-linked oxidoreductase [Schizopora paradoxa]|uniref:tRNA-dihydrouridine synthase n=1 Tax=Schizopora paradoxa TaxID=27342 RepID=A0A0H2S486_9AGAM|nr:FMN-linked oxidoreductase [Schizopora paradoxa]
MDGDLGEECLIIPPQELLSDYDSVNVAAPMVRYSKLPFRHLVSLYDVHVTHTPMILAKEFSRSAEARRFDFSTSKQERGTFNLVERNGKRRRRVRGVLIAQFASSDSRSFADAVELIHPYVDGVDLNCGCPQDWAYQECIGSFLLRQPDTVRDIVRAAKARVDSNYPISIKIRVDKDLKRTDQLIQTAIHAGVSHITVHGRTRHQSSEGTPVSLSSIKFAVEAARGAVPVLANGDVWTRGDCERFKQETGASAVMSARGLLANPALFSGFTDTPPEAVESFVRLATGYGLIFPLFHRHIAYMLESQLPRQERLYLNTLCSYAGVIDFLQSMGLQWTTEGETSVHSI